MPADSSSNTIENFLNERISTATTQEEVHLERIIVLDNAKNEYVDAIRRIDTTLLSTVDEVNDSIYAVNDAYQNRIDTGCRTDLFWRLVGISSQSNTVSNPGGRTLSPPQYNYTYECVRISPTGYPSVGDPPPPFNPFSLSAASRIVSSGPGLGNTIGVSTTTVEYVADTQGTHESVPLDDLFGFQPVNLYSLKMYDEPYTIDIGDTFVTSFIGTCGIGTNIVIAMTPNISGGISNITPGQLLICDKPNVFNTDAYVITGVSTATANLSGINTTNPDSMREVVVPKLILDDNTIQPVFAPEDDGNYVTFTVLSNPDSISDLGLSSDAQPYVPQRIKCPMTSSDRGKGVRIEFDNSGAASGTRTWNQFLEGQTDPDARISGNNESELRRSIRENIVREPVLGGGKVFNKLGFRVAPVIYTNTDRTQYRFAREGETVVLRARMGQPSIPSIFDFYGFGRTQDSAGVIELPLCSGSTNSLLRDAQDVSDRIIAGVASTTIQDNITVANMLRDDLNDINIRIWSERQLLGDAQQRQSTYRQRRTLVQGNRSTIDGN